MSTAKYWWKRHEEEGHVDARQKNGRPSVLNANQQADIIERIKENPFLTAVSFAREFGVDARVISSLFKRHGIKCRIAATEVRLTPEHRTIRVAFCRNILDHWDENKLDSIIFSDEKTFSTDVFWQTKVYRPDNTRFNPEYVTVKDRSGRITHNYWDAIGIEGPVTPIVRIEGRFTAAKYARIIRSHVTPMMDRFGEDGSPRIFMQDNAPQHKAGTVMSLFSRQRFELMDWPAKSPDLNPIENIWARMIHNWPQIHPRNSENLHNAVVERWRSMGENQRKIFKMTHKNSK